MFLKSQTGDQTPAGFFPNLGDQERIRLFNTGTIRTLAEKEFLFKRGTLDKTMYCVLSGVLKIESPDSYTPGFRFKVGDIIGEAGLSNAGGGISSVVAEQASTVFSLDAASFVTLGVETRTAILIKLHQTELLRMESLGKQNKSAQLRAAALKAQIIKSRRHMGKYQESEIIVSILKSIPKLPLHITQLVELLAGQRASAREVAALAKQDPSLVVDILKVINSSRYALPREVTDVSYAVTYMGFNEVYQIVLYRGLMKSFPDSEEFREIYRHSLFLSYIASELCLSYDKNRAALLSTIGLLHDIGETVLLLLRKQNPRWSLFIEMLDPSKLGAMLLEQWNIPKQICQAIEYQDWPGFCTPGEIPSDQTANISLLYVAHATCDYFDSGRIDALDHPFIDDYLRLLGFDSFGIDEVLKSFILEGLIAKSNRLPNFVQKCLARASLAKRGA